MTRNAAMLLVCGLLFWTTISCDSSPIVGPGDSRPCTLRIVDAEELDSMPHFLAWDISYPDEAARLGHQGMVTLELIVDHDGTVCEVEIEESSGYSELDSAAATGLSNSLFTPVSWHGHPVRTQFKLPVKFVILNIMPELGITVYYWADP